MKYKNIGSELFTKNRKKFANKMNAGSIAIFHSNNQMPRNGDAHHKFKQNSDVFYLTGVDQEDTALVIFPDCPNPAYREMLFIKETSETIAVWDGAKLTPEEAKDQTGVTSVFWHHEFWNTIHAIILMADNIYVNLNENDRFPNKVSYNGIEVAHQLKRAYPSHRLLRSAPILTNLRTVKEPEEIALIKEATRITKIGLNKILKYTKPGVKEYEIEAELIYEFTRNRATGFSFEPIIASGKNACVLHYLENNDEVKDGDLLLCDFGVEYANYCSDITRCFPANGKFSARQKEVYNAVLNVHKAARGFMTIGKTLPSYHEEVCGVMSEELIKLGLITRNDVKQNPRAFSKYFMHGTSHHLGLDVHDVMHRYESTFEVGNVLTIEPGIYIPEEGIGVRIENDVHITASGIEDFMEDFPIEVDEIEAAMIS